MARDGARQIQATCVPLPADKYVYGGDSEAMPTGTNRVQPARDPASAVAIGSSSPPARTHARTRFAASLDGPQSQWQWVARTPRQRSQLPRTTVRIPKPFATEGYNMSAVLGRRWVHTHITIEVTPCSSHPALGSGSDLQGSNGGWAPRIPEDRISASALEAHGPRDPWPHAHWALSIEH